MRVLMYARLSQDRSGRSENVEIQKLECTEYAARMGWQLAGSFEDNDLSASKFTTKSRPGYDAMLAQIREGSGDVVLVTEMPRLYRRLEELLELIRLAETTPLKKIETTAGVGYDLSTPKGVHAAISAVSVAMMESARLSERGRRKKAAQARAGLPNGGPRCFGYEPDGMSIREDEARLIREAADQLLNGKPAVQIVAEWNVSGVRTTAGNLWRVTTFRRLLAGKRIAGIRAHNGIEYPGTWPAILDAETAQRLALLFTTGPHTKRRPRGRKYLLTGLVYCGVCGARNRETPLVGYGSIHPDGVERRRYYCVKMTDTQMQRGCGKISRLADPVDNLVAQAVLYRLDSEGMAKLFKQASQSEEVGSLIQQYQTHKDRLSGLVVDYATGLLDREQLALAKRAVEDAIEATRRKLDRLQSGRMVASIPFDQSLREAWDSNGVEWRRSLVSLVVSKVILYPGRAGARMWKDWDDRPWNFDERQVEIVWKV
jgi:site-specific DNA recombinase